MKTIEPKELSAWSGRIIDVREPDEFARERIERAECVPLGGVAVQAAAWDRSSPVLVMCRSGARSRQAAGQLEAMGFQNISTLSGGLQACRAAGVSVIQTKGPIPLQRQVLMAAGLFLLAGLVLSLVHPAFIAVDWFVSSMLVIAGVSGFCPMARILAVMPWNQPTACPRPVA